MELLHRNFVRESPRACLEKAFRELRVPVCGRFYPNEGGVAGYGNRMRVKYTAKWGLQIAEMIFQTRSRSCLNNCIIHLAAESKSLLPIINRKRKCQLINMASPKLKNLYRSCTATSYACMIFSFPASADTSISNVDSGRWKFVIRASIHLNLYPG